MKDLHEHQIFRKRKYVVLHHDDTLNFCDWIIGHITELITSNGKSIRSVIEKTNQ